MSEPALYRHFKSKNEILLSVLEYFKTEMQNRIQAIPFKKEDTYPEKLRLIFNSHTGNGTWEKGTVYDPESGKTYSGKITLNKNGSLNIRGYVGVSLFGKTTVWTRVNGK